MCYTHKLCETENGEISASCCGTCIKISYNNVVMIYNYDAFKTFYESIEECYEEVRQNKSSVSEEIVFATQAKNLFIQFTKQELLEFHYLMQSSLIEYHTHPEIFEEQEPCN